MRRGRLRGVHRGEQRYRVLRENDRGACAWRFLLAIGEAIAKAKFVADFELYYFAIVVLPDGTQLVNEGTPAQVANGMGNARIRGCKALNKWVDELARGTTTRP